MDRHTVASFVRFVVCGGGVGLLSSGALLLMTGAMSIAVANAIVSVVSTVIANELHSRVTFGRGAAGLRVHVESTATAVAAYLVTTCALVGLDAVHGDAGAFTRQAVYLAASGLAGIGRFAVLKLVVFARSAAKPADTARPAKAPAPAKVAVAASSVCRAVHVNTPDHLVAAA